SAIGQVVDHEALGGAKMHAQVSGTIDYREPTDEACLDRLKRLIDNLPRDPNPTVATGGPSADVARFTGAADYDIRDLLKILLDPAPFDEYKAEYGQSLVCGTGRLGGTPVGVVANQKTRTKAADGSLEFGGVIYVDSADKAARFVMDCNQTRVPILFVQNVNGFMVGRDSEQAGIIRAGAKLVKVMSNSVVPKITLIIVGSFRPSSYPL